LNTPRFVIGDALRLRQILINLVGNAVKFTNDGYITLSIATSDLADNVARISFKVEDTGIGISPDKIDYIFQKFSQGEESITRRFGGSGLGLAISRRLTEMMGGEMGVTSEQGKGSIFFFTIDLPIDTGRLHLDKREAPNLGSSKVLILDHSPKAIEIFKEYFAAWQIKSEFYHEHAKALEAVRRSAALGEPFHIALIDDGPETDGGAFIADVRKVGSSSMRFAALCKGEVVQAELLRKKGFDTLIIKPFSPSLLMNKLGRLWANFNGDVKIDFEQNYSESKSAVLASEKKPDFSALKVLVVEDMKVNQIYMQALLKRFQCQAEMADNGVMAVKKVQSQHYDVIFMDCHMPEMDGFEATQNIRTMDIDKQPYIVALTADAMQGDRERCLAAGMDEYLNKPVKPEKIGGILQHFVDIVSGTKMPAA
jgi:CheY-like chemotaxis protein